MSKHPDDGADDGSRRSATDASAPDASAPDSVTVSASEPTTGATTDSARDDSAHEETPTDQPVEEAAAEAGAPRAAQTRRPARPAGDGPATTRKPPIAGLIAVYTLARLALFGVLFLAFWAVGLGSYPGILFALLVSMPLSYVLLGRLREPLTARLVARREQKQAVRSQLRGDQPAGRAA